MSPEHIENYLIYMGQQDEKRMRQKKILKQKEIRMSKQEKQLAIRQAKTAKQLAFHKLLEKMEEEAALWHSISMQVIRSLYKRFLHLRQSLSAMVYKAIKNFNESHDDMVAYFSQKGGHIKFKPKNIAINA